MMEMDRLQNEISTWAESTFKHNERGIALHLLREAVELCDSLGIGDADIRHSVEITLSKEPKKLPDEEAADVTILAFTLAGHRGFNLSDAVVAKHVVNKHRTWGAPDEQGITEHVAEFGAARG